MGETIMAKTKQVLKMDVNGKKFSVVFREKDSRNPYCVYRHTYAWAARDDGAHVYSERKRIEVKYADMRSCLFYLANAV